MRAHVQIPAVVSSAITSPCLSFVFYVFFFCFFCLICLSFLSHFLSAFYRLLYLSVLPHLLSRHILSSPLVCLLFFRLPTLLFLPTLCPLSSVHHLLIVCLTTISSFSLFLCVSPLALTFFILTLMVYVNVLKILSTCQCLHTHIPVSSVVSDRHVYDVQIRWSNKQLKCPTFPFLSQRVPLLPHTCVTRHLFM